MNKDGKFKKIPDGQKTPKMLEVEKKIGKTLEQDYKEMYLSGKIGQKRLAQRWGVPRGLIFCETMRENRKCWVQKLNLSKLDGSALQISKKTILQKGCEICGECRVFLDDAHWIAHAKGGGKERSNILKLCPNCHRLLDSNDPEIIKKGQKILLYREVEKIINSNEIAENKHEQLWILCNNIFSKE